MMIDKSYRSALYMAIALHLFLACLLVMESSTKRPVLTKEAKNEPGELMPVQQTAKSEIVNAVSVDSQEVAAAVNRLKQERNRQLQAEQNRQKQLAMQAEKARAARVLEQQRLAKLKDEAAKLAILRKKQAEEEQKRLKELARKKEQETNELAELKKQQDLLKKKQQEELNKLNELKNKQALEKALKEKSLKEEALKKAEAQKRADAEKAAADAAAQAKMAGEVNRYKALIVNAIGRQWILPENADSHLSSQFRIRLAPDGAVLSVSLIRSSGDSILDRSAQTAIYKASPLPVPADPGTFALFREISLTVRPENVRG